MSAFPYRGLFDVSANLIGPCLLDAYRSAIRQNDGLYTSTDQQDASALPVKQNLMIAYRLIIIHRS